MRIKKEMNIQIGEQIKKARERAKLTQEQLAERIDVSPQFISDLERGVVGVSVATLKMLCACLCVSSDQILFGESVGNISATIADRCRTLTEEQLVLLSDIIDKFVKAIETERHN